MPPCAQVFWCEQCHRLTKPALMPVTYHLLSKVILFLHRQIWFYLCTSQKPQCYRVIIGRLGGRSFQTPQSAQVARLSERSLKGVAKIPKSTWTKHFEILLEWSFQFWQGEVPKGGWWSLQLCIFQVGKMSRWFAQNRTRYRRRARSCWDETSRVKISTMPCWCFIQFLSYLLV